MQLKFDIWLEMIDMKQELQNDMYQSKDLNKESSYFNEVSNDKVKLSYSVEDFNVFD